jgi:chromosome segregation ATPase
MLLFLVALAVVILFVVGITLIYRGYAQTPDLENVIAKEEHTKVQEDLLKAKQDQEQLKVQLDSMAIRLEETKDKILESQKLKESLVTLTAQDKELNEIVVSLKNEKQVLFGKADSQAQGAVEVINSLLSENETLKKELERSENKVDPEDVAKLNTINQELREQLAQQMAKLKELQESLSKREGQTEEKLGQADETIQSLSSENQKLKGGLEEITKKIVTVEQEFLQAENAQRDTATQLSEAQNLLRDAQARMGQFEKDAELLKLGKEENIKQIAALQATLAQQQEYLSEKINPLATDPPDRQAPEIAKWQQEKTALEQSLNELRIVNNKLLEREKVLLFQLTKNRTQAMGLEKICAAYKEQIERQSASAKKSTDHIH